MSASQATFAIVGAGQAGAWAARTLRGEGFRGRVVLIGAERHWPYERPPLSKAVLMGEAAGAGAGLLSAGQAQAAGIEAWLDDTVVAIDRAAKTLSCASGRSLAYDRLFLTTGASARRPPWLAASPSPRVHLLRTADDAERLREAMRESRQLLVVGGGWIGLEIAAAARALGLEVTLLELAPRLCARSVPAAVSAYLEQLHHANGVRLEMGADCERLNADKTGVALELADGRRVSGDHAVIGVGVVPNIWLASACGLAVDDGVIVDAQGRTSDAAVFAAGDVARHESRYGEGPVRLESWRNAQNQAIVAARASLDLPGRYDEPPWSWSDQYGRNLQIVGLPAGAARAVLRGDPGAGTGCWAAYDGRGRLIGAVSVNAPRDLRAIRNALQQGLSPRPEDWADLSQPADRLALHGS